MVTSNRGLMVELIDNLVKNAIRYNVQDGLVEISVKYSGNQVQLKVSDTGIGIPEKDQDRVFERFYRVDKSRSRETGGTGLGLAIVKHIVELHDGEITLHSELGKGTSICIKPSFDSNLENDREKILGFFIFSQTFSRSDVCYIVEESIDKRKEM